MSGFPDYSIIDVSGVTDGANLSTRRSNPNGTLVHCTAGFDSLAWLTVGAAQSGQPASCNFLIGRSGEIWKICPDGYYPYHAGHARVNVNGKWYFDNQVSEALLGIELECSTGQAPTYAQLDALSQIIVQMSDAFLWRWPYTIFGHAEVAMPLGRKCDPWLLDWGSLMGRIYVRALAAGVAGLIP